MKSKNVKWCILATISICLYINTSAIISPMLKRRTILGTWRSQEDSQWKIVFTRNRYHEYYRSNLIETGSYLVSNTSPQCGEIVPIDKYTSYLKITEDGGSKNVNCYEINGVTRTNLSLRPVNNGKTLLFTKQ